MVTYDFCDNNPETFQTFRVEAENDAEADEKAKAHFGQIFHEGRWNVVNEGEDSEGNITHVRYELQRPMYIVRLVCPHHPGDGGTIGVYSTSQKAKQAIKSSVENDARAYPKHPRRDEQQEYNYYIDEHYLDE